jgi:hypothetical protein
LTGALAYVEMDVANRGLEAFRGRYRSAFTGVVGFDAVT